jgi:hypothetical protein
LCRTALVRLVLTIRVLFCPECQLGPLMDGYVEFLPHRVYALKGGNRNHIIKPTEFLGHSHESL